MAKHDDWDDRRLCPDGACVGVLEKDGTCPVCGTRGEATPFRGGPVGDESEAKDEPLVPVVAEPTTAAKAQSRTEDPDIEDRDLCPDGACLGVIGKNGRCKVCGTSAA